MIFELFMAGCIAGTGFAFGYIIGREEKQAAERRGSSILEALSNGYNTTACRRIGEALEITTEGGEDVGEYVEWACRHAWVEEQKADLAAQMKRLEEA
ncbi:hypothetical protein [Luteibacter sp. SG786]|uniref:hypothetical protein n=1 Tax=Luteibacter sp. SG786 TaxID=2587130 RepID=UPI00142225B7|nr:hypothetical protein [Luteibacter sp. SG786]NII53538.1 hypothetical protein [Luteibacter sp. SG786]